jgi:hypothetical protein
MIHVEFDPKDLASEQREQWDRWMIEAREAQIDIITQWETWRKTDLAGWKRKREGKRPEFSPNFKNNVWKNLRDFLLVNVFHNKCAYCETPVVGFPGDAEHFRPKGRVRVKQQNQAAQVVTIMDEDGDQMPHPGYFWLAYHWKNLLPACETCNQGEGKKDLFPVRKCHIGVKRLTSAEINDLAQKITRSQSAEDIFYLEPEVLDQMEDRLLLHPYDDQPKEHIYFKVDGEAAQWPTSAKGSESITIYNLNEPRRKKARNRAQTDGFRYYKDYVLAAIGNDQSELKEAARTVRNEYFNGERPYAAAVFDFIHHWLENSPLDPELLLSDVVTQPNSP